jgi:hypothetical protein
MSGSIVPDGRLDDGIGRKMKRKCQIVDEVVLKQYPGVIRVMISIFLQRIETFISHLVLPG